MDDQQRPVDETDQAIEAALARLQRGLDAVRRRNDLLDRASYAILDRLDTGDATASALAAALHLDLSTIARQIAAAEADGLLRRTPSGGRGRGQTVAMTPTGRRELARARSDRAHRIRATLATWDDRDRADLARLLGRLNDAIDARLTGAPAPP